MFRRATAALNASPEPKKKTKGKQIAHKPVKTTPLINSCTQSTSAGVSSSPNTNGGFKAPKISSNGEGVSSGDDEDDRTPSSLLNLLISQVIPRLFLILEHELTFLFLAFSEKIK